MLTNSFHILTAITSQCILVSTLTLLPSPIVTREYDAITSDAIFENIKSINPFALKLRKNHLTYLWKPTQLTLQSPSYNLSKYEEGKACECTHLKLVRSHLMYRYT